MINDRDGTEGANEFIARGADTPDTGADTGTLARELRTLRKRKGGRVKKPTRLERSRKLHDAIVGLVQELQSAGFASMASPPGSIAVLGPEIEDPKTGGKIGHVQESLAAYIQRLSVDDNFFQRPPFDHVTDPIYRRLIRDFIDGAAMPESKIAALR